jgi:hypothetical protein
MPVGGAVLFGDEDGERHPAYVSSIQVRDGKLSDAELAALGPPTAIGIPLVLPGASEVVAAVDIQRVGGTLSVLWPPGLTGYVLQSSPSLTAPNWQPVNGVNTDCGSATVQVGPGMQFFRLVRP